MGNSKRRKNNSLSMCLARFKKLAEDGPNHHTSNLSRSFSNLVQDTSGCLLEEDDGSDDAKEQHDSRDAK